MRYDKNKDIMGRIEELEDKFRYPYSKLDDTRFKTWVENTGLEEILEAVGKLKELAKKLGYEWHEEQIGWQKNEEERKGVENESDY